MSVEIQHRLLRHDSSGSEYDDLAEAANYFFIHDCAIPTLGYEDMLSHIFRHTFAIQQPLRLIGVADTSTGDAQAAEKFIDAVADLNTRLGVPDVLDTLREEDIAAIAADAVKEGAGYPVPVLMSRKECQAILRTLLKQTGDARAMA